MRKEKVEAVTYRFFQLILLYWIHPADYTASLFQITPFSPGC